MGHPNKVYNFFIFQIASKYFILDSFVEYDGYSTSSKGFLPKVVDITVISSPLLTHTSSGDTQTQFCLSLSGVSGSWCAQGMFESSERLQDGWVMVENSDKTWSPGEGNGKPLHYSCLENPMNRMKRQNDRILKEELLRSVGAQYVTGDQWRNNSRKNEGMEPKQKQYPVVDVTGDRSKVQ